MRTTSFIIALSLGMGLTGLYAQEAITTAGSNASGNGGSASYTIGQVAFQTHLGTNGSVAEGIQQAYEISVVSAIEETEGIDLSLIAYPNPTTDYLTLEVKDIEFSNLNFQLYNMQGKLLQKEKITETETQIDMSGLVPSTYFVKVVKDNKEIKIYKIIKN
ncbi:hypothetical protein ES705_31307 [subsurface metagenome]